MGSVVTAQRSGSHRIRLDEFLNVNGIPMAAVEQFEKFAVDVALPPGWEPFQSPPGTRVCIWPADPVRTRFCANVVLTMIQVEEALDPEELFAMLCEWQADLVPGTHENARDLSAATEGPGVVGTLALHIPAASGPLVSDSVTRILTTGQCTLIAQLTLTALPESPVDRANIGLAVTRDTPPDAATGGQSDPATGTATAGIC